MAKQIEEIPSKEEVEKLIEAFPSHTSLGLRNRACMRLLYGCGLRISEALKLRLKDYDREKRVVRILKSKRNKSRLVGVPKRTAAALDIWLERRKTLELETDLLIPSLQDKPMDASYFRRIVPKFAKEAGLTGRVHLHGLRHAFSVHLMEDGFTVSEISKALGHESIATTAVYLERINQNALLDKLKERD
jgi:integrase/recombinase XerD